VDVYGLPQVRRQFRLTAIESYILLMMTLQADWRDPFWSWEGTITDLHEDTGVARKAISSAFTRLAEQRCISIERPFTGGRTNTGGTGIANIRVYEWLIKVHSSQRIARQSARDLATDLAPVARQTARDGSTDHAPITRPLRADHAPFSRQVARDSCLETDERGKGQRGSGGEGSAQTFSEPSGFDPQRPFDDDVQQVPTRDAPCPFCGHPAPRKGSLGWFACPHQQDAGLTA
jgi:hypothetical protein